MSKHFFNVLVIIPLADNAGVTFDATTFATFEVVLTDVFGGWTRLTGEVAGAWMGGPSEHHRVYVIGLASILDAGSLRVVVDRAKVIFRQDAIFISYAGHSEEL